MRFTRSWVAGTSGESSAVASSALTLTLFAAAMFVSALLMFIVQPMFAKMVLPILGGSPAVWAVAMCFFQIVLLGGYAYAHALTRFLRPERVVLVHLAVMVLALASLPLALSQAWGAPPTEGLHLWIFGLFAASIGLPFFALSGNAPLLQAWFARTGHPHAGDPYFLYGASNIGSLLALLAYPVLVEPNTTLGTQSALWSLTYKLLILLIGASAIVMLVRGGGRLEKRSADALAGDALSDTPVTTTQRLSWLGLAFVPSGLLVAVTTHITTDVAAAPFLWVLPLALFLLTFVITFQKKPVLKHAHMLAIQPLTLSLLVLSILLPLRDYWPAFLALHLVAFFVNTMVCHGELVRRRPKAANLTEFYLWMSLGGALGGLFTGLLAPQIFSTVAEYPLLIALAALARPGFWPLRWASLKKEGGLALVLLAVTLSPKLLLNIELVGVAPWLYMGIFAVLWALMILSRENAVRLAAVVATTLIVGTVLRPNSVKGEYLRGFFGVHKIAVTRDGKFRLLSHGTTLHGAQALSPELAHLPPEPLTYYHSGSPFADVFRALRAERTLDRVGLVGLGTGSLACYKRPGETWRFFEIDPIVVRIARDRSLFRFLSDCAPDAAVVVGDARLTLAKEPRGALDLLVLDAFSSDAIPVHLLTREAVAGYLERLKDNGVLVLHVSNRNMDLVPVLASIADSLGLVGLTRHGGHAGKATKTYKTPAIVVALARRDTDLADLKSAEGWEALPPATWQVWTDDYSNVLTAILARFTAEKEEASE